MQPIFHYLLQECLACQPTGLPFDPLDEFENVEQTIDRRRICHQKIEQGEAVWTREIEKYIDVRAVVGPVTCNRAKEEPRADTGIAKLRLRAASAE